MELRHSDWPQVTYQLAIADTGWVSLIEPERTEDPLDAEMDTRKRSMGSRRRPVIVESLASVLPFEELSPAVFEELVLDLVRLDSDVEHAQRFGGPGQGQGGIDVYCRLRGTSLSPVRYRTVQCRRKAVTKPSELKAAVDQFLKGEWAERSDVFVFATSASNVRSERARVIEEMAARLRKRNVQFEVWDQRVLSTRLRDLPNLVLRYFDVEILRQFCGTAAADRLMADSREFPVVVGMPPPAASCFQERPQIRQITAAIEFDGDDGPMPVVLVGMGGAGKSQLAAWCVRRAREQGTDVVVWASAASREAVVSVLAEAAVAVGRDKSGSTEKKPIASCRGWQPRIGPGWWCLTVLPIRQRFVVCCRAKQ